MPTSSQIVSKLDLERLYWFYTHILYTNNQESTRIEIESSHIFVPTVYANAFLRIYSYAPGLCHLFHEINCGAISIGKDNRHILEDFENASLHFCTFLANHICD